MNWSTMPESTYSALDLKCHCGHFPSTFLNNLVFSFKTSSEKLCRSAALPLLVVVFMFLCSLSWFQTGRSSADLHVSRVQEAAQRKVHCGFNSQSQRKSEWMEMFGHRRRCGCSRSSGLRVKLRNETVMPGCDRLCILTCLSLCVCLQWTETF